MRIVLASASPARLATLRAAGVDPEVVVSGVDESPFDDPDAASRAVALAQAKAAAVAGRADCADADLIIGCDSVLSFDGEIYGKPGDESSARTRWRAMRGKHGTLVTGHALISPRDGRTVSAAARTTVYFAALTNSEIDAYVASQEPLNVAGAFTIDGLGGAFIERIEGDPHNVVGVSLPLLRVLVGRLGWSWPDLWARGPTRGPGPAMEPHGVSAHLRSDIGNERGIW